MTRTAEDTDVRITPEWLWRDGVLVFAGGRLICDVCTEENNPLGAHRFFTERTNGLDSRWATTLADLRNTLYWGNVPYSRGQVMKWADKFAREGRFGLECLMLTQADVSTDWYRFIRENADARCHLGRRVVFLEPDGKGGYQRCESGAKFGSQIAYWGPRRRRFERVFSAFGEVIHGLGPQEESEHGHEDRKGNAGTTVQDVSRGARGRGPAPRTTRARPRKAASGQKGRGRQAKR